MSPFFSLLGKRYIAKKKKICLKKEELGGKSTHIFLLLSETLDLQMLLTDGKLTI